MNASGVDYLVLRNYEMMLIPELFIEDHVDINLCIHLTTWSQQVSSCRLTNG